MTKDRTPGQKSLHGRAVSSCLVFVAALWLMAEECIWDYITALMQRISRLPFIARIEGRIVKLNPYAAFVLFFVPMAMLFPMKLYAAYLISSGEVVRGLVFIIIAKTVTTAVITKLFILCRPQLMTIALFQRFYTWFIDTKTYLYEMLEQFAAWRLAKARVKAFRAWISGVRSKYGGHGLFRRLKGIKDRMKKKYGPKAQK